MAQVETDEDWGEMDRVFAVTQFGAMYTCRTAARAFRAAARETPAKILVIGSIMSEFSSSGRVAYQMSKAVREVHGG